MTFEPTLEQLILFQRDQLEKPMRQKVQDHLAAECAHCDAEMQWIRSVFDALTHDPAEVAPEAMDAVGRRIFSDFRRREDESDPSVLHGIMVFDSAWVPLPSGTRAPVSGQRRLLFSADPFEVDLEISRIRRGRYDLLGQILPAEQLPPERRVTLRRPRKTTVMLDARGVFAFDGVVPGRTDLTFSLGSQTVKLSGIQIG